MSEVASGSLSLPVLWQDEHLVVVHKPSGWLVHRTGLDAHEYRIVLQVLRDQLGRHVYPVHRLDKGTSGVLVMALSPEVARSLSEQFEQRQVHKRYLALVRGWPSDAWQVNHPLRPDDAPPDAPLQEAVTDFITLARWSLPIPVDRYPSTRVALVQAEPHTGRRHQIRRHLKHVAHPIIGDANHGKGAHNRWWAEHLGVQRLWLHAASLSLAHPVTHQLMHWRSPVTDEPLNADWSALLARGDWQWQASHTPASLQAL